MRSDGWLPSHRATRQGSASWPRKRRGEKPPALRNHVPRNDRSGPGRTNARQAALGRLPDPAQRNARPRLAGVARNPRVRPPQERKPRSAPSRTFAMPGRAPRSERRPLASAAPAWSANCRRRRRPADPFAVPPIRCRPGVPPAHPRALVQFERRRASSVRDGSCAKWRKRSRPRRRAWISIVDRRPREAGGTNCRRAAASTLR